MFAIPSEFGKRPRPETNDELRAQIAKLTLWMTAHEGDDTPLTVSTRVIVREIITLDKAVLRARAVTEANRWQAYDLANYKIG